METLPTVCTHLLRLHEAVAAEDGCLGSAWPAIGRLGCRAREEERQQGREHATFSVARPAAACRSPGP